jgi:hypothetical protein
MEISRRRNPGLGNSHVRKSQTVPCEKFPLMDANRWVNPP